jgi:MFS transporter, putative metabolite:H+ symporter
MAQLPRFVGVRPSSPGFDSIREVAMAEFRAVDLATSPAIRVLGQKLDSIPFSRYHILIIGVLGFVGFVEGYDLAMTGSLLVLAKEPLHLTPGDIRLLTVAATLMLCVGGFAASAISDHWSRKRIMQIGVVGTTFFTLMIPLVQNAEQLIIVRLLTGLAGGFAVSAPFPIGAELMPAQHRRTYGAVYEMSLAGAFTVLPLAGFLLAGNPSAFRFMALAGGLMLFIAPALIHFVIPESPRWHLRRGRLEVAVAAVNRIIHRCGNRVPPLSSAILKATSGTSRIYEELPPYWALFRAGQLRWTVVGVLSGVCAGTAAMLINLLLPKALVDQGAAVSMSFGLATIVYVASIPGKAFTGFLMEILGRRWTITYALAGSLPGLVLMLMAASRRRQRDYCHGRGRGDHRVHGIVGLYRHPSLPLRAVPDGIARARTTLRRVVRTDFCRRSGTVPDGVAHRLADDLLRYDRRRGRDRCLHPTALWQGDRRPAGDYSRRSRQTRLTPNNRTRLA